MNIEGLALHHGRLLVGLRSPNLEGCALVLDVVAEDLFAAQTPVNYRWHRLPVGAGYGVRSLLHAGGELLVVVGNAGAEPSDRFPTSEDYHPHRPFLVYRWDGADQLRPIGRLADVSGKAEAMLVIGETDSRWEVLVLFDGARHGHPTLYHLPK